VAAASLRNNYQQSLALSLAERRSARDLPDYALLMQALEAHDLLDRGLEALPSDMELQERGRAGRGLTRPELAVLLSYAKLALQHDLLDSPVPDDPQMQSWLTGYFPPLLRERYRAGIDAHSLRREIVALGLTNTVVNRGGPALAVRLASETGATTPEVARAFMAVREVLDLPRLWQRIDALDGRIGGAAQLGLYEATRNLLADKTLWLIASGAAKVDLAATVASHKAALATLQDGLESVLPPARKESLRLAAARLADSGVPGDLALDMARLEVLAQAPAIAEIAEETGAGVRETARISLEIGQRLKIDELAARGAAIATADRYDRLAIAKALGQLAAAQAVFTREAIRAGGSEAWYAAQGERLGRVERILAEVAGPGTLSLSRLAVAAATLGDLAVGRL
jgi:glutamate dehydrogenase